MSPADASSSELKLTTEETPDALIVHCDGRLMGDGATLLRNTIKPLLPSHRRIVLDFTNVTHSDSMGLGAVAGLYVSAKTAGAQLQLVNLGTPIRKLFTMTNLLSLFEFPGDDMIRLP